MARSARHYVENLFEKADIQINGSRPWDVQVHNDNLFDRIVHHGSIGLGEAYMDKWWDAQALDQFFAHLLQIDIQQEVKMTPHLLWLLLSNRLFNRQNVTKARIVGERHYDAGNDIYQAMLDDRMVYTCGYWKDANTLNEAQEAKLDLICKKIGLEEGMHVLDIGCGWGSFAKFAAQHYGATVTGVTISKEQATLGSKLCENLPVDIRLQDYRSIEGTFDRIVSIGMFEHVGYKNYRVFMEKTRELLKDDGLFLLHTIGGNRSVISTDPWLDKYIFPGGMLPSIAQIGAAIENIFVMEDWHNFGSDYDKTLMAWFENFDAAWPDLQTTYNERFYRMWAYYLLSCAGSFRARRNQLWQIILSPKGTPGGYTSIR